MKAWKRVSQKTKHLPVFFKKKKKRKNRHDCNDNNTKINKVNFYPIIGLFQ